jgi:hypothetical protein
VGFSALDLRWLILILALPLWWCVFVLRAFLYLHPHLHSVQPLITHFACVNEAHMLQRCSYDAWCEHAQCYHVMLETVRYVHAPAIVIIKSISQKKLRDSVLWSAEHYKRTKDQSAILDQPRD